MGAGWAFAGWRPQCSSSRRTRRTRCGVIGLCGPKFKPQCSSSRRTRRTVRLGPMCSTGAGRNAARRGGREEPRLQRRRHLPCPAAAAMQLVAEDEKNLVGVDAGEGAVPVAAMQLVAEDEKNVRRCLACRPMGIPPQCSSSRRTRRTAPAEAEAKTAGLAAMQLVAEDEKNPGSAWASPTRSSRRNAARRGGREEQLFGSNVATTPIWAAMQLVAEDEKNPKIRLDPRRRVEIAAMQLVAEDEKNLPPG